MVSKSDLPFSAKRTGGFDKPKSLKEYLSDIPLPDASEDAADAMEDIADKSAVRKKNRVKKLLRSVILKVEIEIGD